MAEVAWRQGTRIGVEFARPLPDRVLSLLAASDWIGARQAAAEAPDLALVRRVL